MHLRGPLPAKEGWAGQWAEDSPRWTPEALSRLRSGSTSNYLRYLETDKNTTRAAVEVALFLPCKANTPD